MRQLENDPNITLTEPHFANRFNPEKPSYADVRNYMAKHPSCSTEDAFAAIGVRPVSPQGPKQEFDINDPENNWQPYEAYTSGVGSWIVPDLLESQGGPFPYTLYNPKTGQFHDDIGTNECHLVDRPNPGFHNAPKITSAKVLSFPNWN